MFKNVFQQITIKQKKWAALIAGSIFLIFIALGGYGYSKREVLLERAIQRAKAKLRTAYDVDLLIGSYSFKNLTTVAFNNIQLVPLNRPTIAEIQQLNVSVRLTPLLFGDVKIGQLNLERGAITFIKRDSLRNYDFLLKKKEKQATDTPQETNYAALANRMLETVFFNIPSDMEMNNFDVSYEDDSTFQKIALPHTKIESGDIRTTIILNEQEAKWEIEGHVNPDRNQLRLRLAADNKNVELPLLRRKFGLKVQFEFAEFDLQRVKRPNKKLLELAGEWQFSNLVVNHWRLSERDILIPSMRMAGLLNIGATSIEIADETVLKVKDFECHPYLQYTHGPEKRIALGLHTNKIPAQTFFDAIPQGLFESLEDIQVAGNIKYDLDFAMDIDKPDALIFTSKMDDADLKIVRWGKADVNKLNGPFEYQAYDGDQLVRTINVSPSNPNYTPLNQISREMRISVLNAEDPFFMRHNGFEEEAFRLSIATNVKEKRFKRGASTISMQLVKNVFLNRNKTVVRKVEEIILVWLMERSQQVSKNRMYEVYLNVIEWGKNIYGITEAARYYFGKRPADLTLGESIFLSSIVPRPKKGLYAFDYTGHLKPTMLRYFNIYGNILLKTGQIAADSTQANYGFYQVQLQPHLRPIGPAIQLDSLDLLLPQEEEIAIEDN